MKNFIALYTAALCLFLSSCHRPVAYFQRTPHPAATRLPIEQPVVQVNVPVSDSVLANSIPFTGEVPETPAIASLSSLPAQTVNNHIERRMQWMQSLLSASMSQPVDHQPGPKPKKKLKLGNQIRQSFGMPLRPELNWWQRISWKLKASVFVILVAVIFAILHITLLAIIFGIVGAFLLISGLKRSFKVRRPWF